MEGGAGGRGEGDAGRKRLDDSENTPRVADSGTGEAAQKRFSLRADFFFAGKTKEDEIGSGAGVDDGEGGGRFGSGREEEETKGLVVELDDAARQSSG
jgi:hypothetical protein